MANPELPLNQIAAEIGNDLGADAFKFLQFRGMMDRMEEESKYGSVAAFEVIQLVRRFHRLVKISQQG